MADAQNDLKPEKVIGRYALYGAIARGGMATVHLGRLLGPVGFTKPVAIKRLHAHLACDPQFTTMFLDEARLAARISHPNVVPTLDVVALEGELFLVMEYIHGESLAQLLRLMDETKKRIDPGVVANIMSGALQGLHAAHDATNEAGEDLNIVHRDFTPQNIIVGADGVARVLDFGVAKAMGQSHTTREGQLKGKLKYMAPEQIGGLAINRQTDVFSASVVLWEMLTGRQLFTGANDGELLYKVMEAKVEPPSSVVSGLPRELDAVVLKGLERNREKRWATALDLAIALEKAITMVTQREVKDWIQQVAGSRLDKRKKRVLAVETSSSAPGREIDADVAKTPADPTDPVREDATSSGATMVMPDGVSAPRTAHVEIRRTHLVGGAAAMLVVGGAIAVWSFSGDAPAEVPAEPQGAGLTNAEPTTGAATSIDTEKLDKTKDEPAADASARPSTTATADAAAPTATAKAAAPPTPVRRPPPRQPPPPPPPPSGPDPSQFSRD